MCTAQKIVYSIQSYKIPIGLTNIISNFLLIYCMYILFFSHFSSLFCIIQLLLQYRINHSDNIQSKIVGFYFILH